MPLRSASAASVGETLLVIAPGAGAPPWGTGEVAPGVEGNEAGAPAEVEHRFGLPVPDLEHHVCAAGEQRRRLREDAPEERILVSTAVESGRRVPLPDLRREPALGGDLVHVGRVRDEEVDGAAQRLKAVRKVCSVEVYRCPVSLRVPAGDLEGSVRDVGGVDVAEGSLLGDGDRDGARARPDIDHPARAAAQVYPLQRQLHDALCVGARDEGVAVQVEPQVPEVRVAKNTLHGLASQAAGDPGVVELRLFLCERFIVECYLPALYIQQLGEENLG